MERLRALLFAGLLAGCRDASNPDTLVVLAERDVEGLDPHTSGQVWQTQMVLSNVYESLVAVDRTMALRPGLAVSWSNSDDLTWEFELRPGVSFQDGEPLEAEDVIFSLERARKHPDSVLRVNLATLQEVRAVGGRVRLRTTEPDASLLPRLREVFIVSRRCVERTGELGLAAHSCGTGPYAIAGRAAGNYVDLARFDHYWGGVPPIPKARFVARTRAAADAGQFVTPSGRLMFWSRPGAARSEPAEGEALRHEGPGLAVLYLSFDLNGPRSPAVLLPDGSRVNPFLDARVREAVGRAIDRERLRRAVSGQAAEAAQFVSAFVTGFDPALAVPTPDPDGARRVLAETPFRGGFQVELDLREIHAGLGPPLAEDLASLGIRVRSHVVSEAEFFRRLREGRSSLAVQRFSCWTGDAQTFYDKVIHSRRPELGYGVFNYSYAENPVAGLDAEIEAARRIMDPHRRLTALSSLTQRVLAARLAIPLLQERDLVFTSPDVEWAPRADTFRLVSEMRFRQGGR